MLVVLSLALVGFFLVCLRTLVKATFRCCSGVVNRKYLWQRCVFEKRVELEKPSLRLFRVNQRRCSSLCVEVHESGEQRGWWVSAQLFTLPQHLLRHVTGNNVPCDQNTQVHFVCTKVPKTKRLIVLLPNWLTPDFHPSRILCKDSQKRM